MTRVVPRTKIRCKWADSNELLAAYHDAEWGVPVHDDRLLFEMLNLEGAQVDAVVANAKAFLAVQEEFGSFDRYIWRFVGGKPVPRAKRKCAITASEAMSRDLAGRGFRFVGATICFAFMQATGMVSDHEAGCFRA